MVMRWVCVMLFCLGMVSLMADTLSEKASLAYESHQYQEAKSLYQEALSLSPDHPDLMFNMGVVCLKSGEIGESILWFLRSDRLDPGRSDVHHNLSIARSSVIQPVQLRTNFFELLISWPVRHVSLITFLWVGVVLSLCLILSFLISSSSIYIRIVFLIMFILVCLGTGWRYVLDQRLEGVIVLPKVVLRSAPSRTVRVIMYLHEGVEVVLGERYADWQEVILGNGVVGWVQLDSVKKR